MASAIEIFIEATNPTIADQLVVPPRAERRLPIPGRYTSGGTGAYLTAKFGQCETLYRHQSLALRKIAQGRNVVISTGTASGKTEPFQTPVIHEMLEGDGTVIVVQPMKALSGDQLARWKVALALAGLSLNLVAEINGDVPIHEREEILARARIILITPDVLHAWFTRSIASAVVNRFLGATRILVIDEAHLYEGAFGTSSAYLFRRLRVSKELIGLNANRKPTGFQIIAASATIREPAAHLKLLTGREFSEVTEKDNGAPFYGLTLIHAVGPGVGTPGEKGLAAVIKALSNRSAPGALLAFADMRRHRRSRSSGPRCATIMKGM